MTFLRAKIYLAPGWEPVKTILDICFSSAIRGQSFSLSFAASGALVSRAPEEIPSAWEPSGHSGGACTA